MRVADSLSWELDHIAESLDLLTYAYLGKNAFALFQRARSGDVRRECVASSLESTWQHDPVLAKLNMLVDQVAEASNALRKAIGQPSL